MSESTSPPPGSEKIQMTDARVFTWSETIRYKVVSLPGGGIQLRCGCVEAEHTWDWPAHVEAPSVAHLAQIAKKHGKNVSE